MKRFLIVILFSLLFSIQNTSANSPTLDETIEFLINGDGGFFKKTWSITDCNLTIFSPEGQSVKVTRKIDLNKVNLKTFEPHTGSGASSMGFFAKCTGICEKESSSLGNEEKKYWGYINDINWERNVKALSHLYSNFCEGAKSAF